MTFRDWWDVYKMMYTRSYTDKVEENIDDLKAAFDAGYKLAKDEAAKIQMKRMSNGQQPIL